MQIIFGLKKLDILEEENELKFYLQFCLTEQIQIWPYYAALYLN